MANLVPLNLQGHTARSLSLGSYHACVVSEVGTLWCWGQTSKGALGAALFQSVSQVLVPTAIVNQLGLVTYAPSRSPTRSPSFMPTKSPTLSLVTLSPQFIGVLVPPTGKVVVPIHALANYQVDHFSASVCPGNESYISVQLPASQTMAAGNSQSISVSVFNPGNFAMSPYGRAPVWHGGCVLMSADSATHSATQLIELNATFYLVCPPGAYNNDGDNVNQGCMHCVAGGYELAADTDRMQCAGLPCASGYWCGQSAVQGSTYRPILSASNITGNMVVKARKLVSWTIVNLDPSEDAFVALPLATLAANPWLKSITLPGGSFMDPQASNGSTNFASVPAQSASTTVQLDLDASLFVIPFGESVFNAPIALEWWLASNPAEVFIMTIPVVINVVTVLVTPKIFTYSLSAGQTYGKLVFPNSTDLSPPGEVQLLNSLCNNSITFTIRQGCAGNAVPQTPAWFRFLQPVGVTQTIEPQVGLGVLQDFGVDLTGAIHTQLLAQASDKAQSLLQCFTYDIELNGLNTSVLIPVTVSVTALVPCPPGYVSATGDNSAGCTVCSKSLYQNASGSTACLPCSSGVPTTLTTGATSAADCVSAINTFRLSDTDTSSKPCPSQANCSEEGVTLRSLRLRPGYWRTSANSSTILTCPFWDFCVGGRAPPLPSSDSRRRLGPMRALQNSSATASPTAALPENSLCAPHHHGVFCQNCDAGYVHRGPLRLCAVCDVASQAVDSQRIAGIMSGIALLVLFLFGFVYLRMRWTRMAQHNKLQGSQRSIRQGLENVMNVLDGVKLKIVIGLLQVVSGMSVQFVLVLPALFQQVAQVVNVFSLDLLKLFDFGCSLPAQNHYTSLVLTTNLPLLGCLFVLGVYVLARSMFRDDATSLQEARILCFTFFLVILFLVSVAGGGAGLGLTRAGGNRQLPVGLAEDPADVAVPDAGRRHGVAASGPHHLLPHGHVQGLDRVCGGHVLCVRAGHPEPLLGAVVAPARQDRPDQQRPGGRELGGAADAQYGSGHPAHPVLVGRLQGPCLACGYRGRQLTAGQPRYFWFEVWCAARAPAPSANAVPATAPQGIDPQADPDVDLGVCGAGHVAANDLPDLRHDSVRGGSARHEPVPGGVQPGAGHRGAMVHLRHRAYRDDDQAGHCRERAHV
jgi:hypothetical protein